MVLLANRVSACVPAPTMASSSPTPIERAVAAARPKISSACLRVINAESCTLSTGIGAANLDVPKARGTCAVAGAHHLFGLPFAAVGRPPKCPVPRVGDRHAG